MDQTSAPKAATVFGDSSYGEMLEFELRLAGFEISDQNKADLMLTESDLLPYVGNNSKFIISFLPTVLKDDTLPRGSDIVFPRIFLLSELRKELKRIYTELVSRENIQIANENESKAWANSKISHQNPNCDIYTLPDRSVMVCGKKIPLSTKEWKLLDMLYNASKSGKAVSRQELGMAMGHAAGESGNIVDVYICRLRRKIELPLGRRLIFTARGLGYSLGNLKEKGDSNEK